MVRCGGNAELRGLERRAACGHAAPRSGGEARGSWECATARGGRYARARGKLRRARKHERRARPPAGPAAPRVASAYTAARVERSTRPSGHRIRNPDLRMPCISHISTVSRLVVTKIAPDIPTTFLQKKFTIHTLCMTPLTGPHQRGAERADSVRPLRSEWPHASRAQHGRHSRSSSPSSF